MITGEITFDDVVKHYATPCTTHSKVEKDNLLNWFYTFKTRVDERRDSLLARLEPGQQPHLRKTIETLYFQQLYKFTDYDLLVDSLFPTIDMSFINRTVERKPRWALFSSDLTTDTFSLTYTKSVRSSRSDKEQGTAHLNLEVFDRGDWLTVEPKSYLQFFNDKDKELLINSLTHYFDDSVFGMMPSQRNQYDTGWIYSGAPSSPTPAVKRLLDISAISWPTDSKVTATFTATFGHFLPAEVKKKIEHFQFLFDEMFFVAEIPDWQHDSLEIISVPAADPLLIGRKGSDYRLLAAFELSDAETYITREFTH
ncbi:MAG: hypothetical protein K2X29_14410 [Candidatus Obscuribacterales bacterium]|nr:hypothetical protein [Candidatus Obscuribacterales bacterium]